MIGRIIPLISVTATCGARMQEGTISPYQMTKTISAVLKLKDAGVLTSLYSDIQYFPDFSAFTIT